VTRFLLAGGWLAALIGAGLAFPVVVARLETGVFTGPGIGVGSAACVSIACGVAALAAGWRRRRGPSLPGGVRAAAAADVLFLAFCALEVSDGLVRQGGRVVYWTTFLFPPALVLLYGLLSARRWAWWVSRRLAAVAVVWFLGFLAVIPFADLRGEGGPTPWYGRVYAAGVTVAFAGVAAAAYWSLGRPEVRGYFGLVRQEHGRGEAANERHPPGQAASPRID
jgi:hypothetical protein